MSQDHDETSSELSARNEPPGAHGYVDAPQPEEDTDRGHGEPGIDDFIDNTRALLSQSAEVLLFIWVAIILVMSTPALWKIAQGYDPMRPLDMDPVVMMVEFGCHALAIALFTLSLPIGRAYLLGDGEGPQTFGEAWEVAGEHVDDAVLITVIYYVAVIVGLMMCVFPGLFAAAYLAPALYLAAARGEPTFRALLKGTTQIGRYSNLYVFIVIGLGVVFLGVSLALGLVVNHAGGSDELAVLATEPIFMVFFSLGFLVVTAILYLLYIAAMGLFITIEAAETGQVTRPNRP